MIMAFVLRGLSCLATVAAALAVSTAASAQGAPATTAAGGSDAALQFTECTRTPTDADVEGAKGAHKAATQFFERGDYDRALQYWRDAYGFDCSRPPLLLNISSAYEKKGDKAAAVSVLELFLTRAKDSPDAPVVQEKIANLRAALDADKAAATPKPVAPPTMTPPPPPSADQPLERPFGHAPWIVVVAGGAVALAGIVPLAIGGGKISDAEELCPERNGCSAEAVDLGNSGRTLSLVGQIMIPAGLVTAAGGLVWQFAFNGEQPVAGAEGEPAAPRSGHATFTPAVGPDFQGAIVTGAF